MGISAQELNVGDSRDLHLFDDLSRTQIVMYAGASGDYNPIHTDEKYTTEIAGFPSVFAHGMLTMGATGRVVTDWFGVDRIIDFSSRFTGQVWPGAALSTTCTVEAIREEDGEHLADLKLVTVGEDGKPVLSGAATVRLDA
jgi:acyl dehydratase